LQGGQYKLLFGRVIGSLCDLLWEDHIKSEAMNFLNNTESIIKYGDCPIEPQTIKFINYLPQSIGEHLPNFLPGNERWKLKVYYNLNDTRVYEFDSYVLIRDEKSIFDSVASG
jgi:hypothetical protein